MSSYTRVKPHTIYVTCRKCRDSFILDYGGKSIRRSCRCHEYINGECTDCGKIESRGGHNCYHVRQYSCLGCDYCTVS